MSDFIVSDGSHSSGGRVLWGDQGPAYVQGWRDSLLAFAAVLDQEADGLVAPAARLTQGIAEMARRRAQDGPGAPAAPKPALEPDPPMDPLFDMEGTT